jgi:uncharacterized protein (DUF1499 family)
MSNAVGPLARFALLVGIIAAAMIASAGPVYRFAGVDLMTAFSLLKWGSYAAIGTAAIAVVWLVVALIARSAGGLVYVIAALAIAGAAFAVPATMQATAASVPPIHDITTDTANPPVFVAIAPLRADAPNGTDYNAAENAEAQAKAYPDIKSLIIEKPPAEVFETAKKAAADSGWEIVAAEPGEGRIEATDTTAWFGFKDDVVVRITAEGTGTRVDVRSMSRVGKSDLGKNASRIRDYLAKLSGG